MAELEALGHPAAAGDPELLERLGWTRPYTSRVLANLEAHGLLRSFPGPTTGQGRPPKLYEPEPKSVMLEQIARHRVFASVTAIEELAGLYVSSDQLAGLHGDERPEAQLMRPLFDEPQPQRSQVVGPSGAGKTGFIFKVLGDLARRTAAGRAHEVLVGGHDLRTVLNVADAVASAAHRDGADRIAPRHVQPVLDQLRR